MKFFDSHSQLQFSQYDADRDEVISRMRVAEVGTLAIGTDTAMSRAGAELAQSQEDIWATVGIHPTSIKDVFDKDFFEELLQKPKVVAVGECGLDYFHEPYDKEAQKELFVKHIELAKEHALPLIIHCRPSAGTQDAYHDMARVLKEKDVSRGVMHFFVGGVDEAQAFLEQGLYVSFAGPVTFTEEYDRVITAVPLERILIETDAPFAAPAPYRGKQNEPAYVVEVARKVAAVKGITLEEVALQTIQNAQELFGL